MEYKEIAREYGSGESLGEIGARYGLTRAGVAYILEVQGIGRRSRSEARLLALERKKIAGHRKNEFRRGIFDGWDNESVYLTGIVYGRGSLTRDGLRFSFGRSTLELGENIADVMGGSRPEEYDNGGYAGWRLVYGSYEMVERLIRIGVPINKGDRGARFPDIPSGLQRHFIRGYWDGSGGVGEGGIEFYSSSVLLLGGIGETIKHTVGLAGVIQLSGRLYTLQYGACEELYDLFYEGVEPPLAYESKRIKFLGSF